MRALASVGVAGLLALGACGLGSSSLTGGGASGGSSGAGGAAGGAAMSLGSVTFDLVLPAGTTFCDENASCAYTPHFWLSTGAGEPLSLGPVGCNVDCATCMATPCPSLAAVLCPAGNVGVAVDNETFTWDGSYVARGTCGGGPVAPSGPVIPPNSCVSATYAASGTYIARFCATPGTLVGGDGGPAQCTPVGAQYCTQAAFAYPAATRVTLSLPSPYNF